MYIYVVGYYVYRESKLPIHDGGLSMVYQSEDTDAVIKDFTDVAHDLMFSRQLEEDEEIEFSLDVVQPLSSPPKFWKNRSIQKL